MTDPPRNAFNHLNNRSLRFLRALGALEEIVGDFVDKCQSNGESEANWVAALLHDRDEYGNHPTQQQLRDEIVTMVLNSYDTTALVLSWAFCLLAQHPDAEIKLADEIQRVIGERAPTYADVHRLSYTQGVVKESMRLYPPVWAMTRKRLVDHTFGGYRLPAGSTLVVSQWLLQRDPRYNSEPHRFDPTRWLTCQRTSAQRCTYIPFGAGKRICIGESFVIMEVVLILDMIAQRFKLQLCGRSQIEPRFATLLRPSTAIYMKLTRRQLPTQTSSS